MGATDGIVIVYQYTYAWLLALKYRCIQSMEPIYSSLVKQKTSDVFHFLNMSQLLCMRHTLQEVCYCCIIWNTALCYSR